MVLIPIATNIFGSQLMLFNNLYKNLLYNVIQKLRLVNIFCICITSWPLYFVIKGEILKKSLNTLYTKKISLNF